jgi:hypothetical protein
MDLTLTSDITTGIKVVFFFLNTIHRLHIFFFFLVGLGFELRPLCLQTRCFTTWDTPSVHFALVNFEMESLKPFAQSGLELPKS